MKGLYSDRKQISWVLDTADGDVGTAGDYLVNRIIFPKVGDAVTLCTIQTLSLITFAGPGSNIEVGFAGAIGSINVISTLGATIPANTIVLAENGVRAPGTPFVVSIGSAGGTNLVSGKILFTVEWFNFA